MGETILEETVDLDRQELRQTIRLADGSEVIRISSTRPLRYSCSICGKVSDKPEFPESAIGCNRKDCR